MKITFGTRTVEFDSNRNEYRFVLDGKVVPVILHDSRRERLGLIIDGKRITAYVSSDGAKRWVTVNGQTVLLTKTSGARQGVRHDHAGGLIAPMPGQVRSVAVSVGDVVKQSQTLLTMEAMKMEIRIQALKDGKVKAVHVTQGQTVEREQILIEMED